MRERDTPEQGSPFSEAAIEELEAELEMEALMEAPPEGELAVIADEDVPGAPG